MSTHSPKAELSCTRVLVALMFASSLLTGGCALIARSSEPEQPRIILLAIDGLETRHLEELGNQGLLPHLSRLASEGSFSEIRSIQPLISPVIWTSVASGMTPERHGVAGWLRENGEQKIVDAHSVKVKRFWEIFDAKAIPTAVIGWLAAFPALPSTHGLTVTTKFLWSDEVGRKSKDGAFKAGESLKGDDAYSVQPTEDALWLMEEMVYSEEVTNSALGDQVDYVPLSTHPYARDEYAVRIAVRTIEKKKPEVMAVYLKGIDELSHLFWQFKDRQFRRSMKQRPHDYAAASAANPVLRMPWSGESMSEGKLELGGEVVDRYLVWVDEAVGRILDAAGGNPDVIVMSDHGFTSMAREGGLTSPEHRLMGTLILHGPSFDPDAVLMAPSMLDITPTLLHMRRLPVGEDMVGRPLVEALEDQRPVDWIHTYEDSPIYRADVEDQDESFEYDRLRALGYVE